MQIEVLVNLGTNDFPETPFKEGMKPTVSEQLGRKLVSLGYAKDITPAAEKIAQLAEPAAPANKEPEPVSEPQSTKQDKPQKHVLKSSKEK